MIKNDRISRPLGTMIVYGYPSLSLDGELEIAHKIGAQLLEILPFWASYPDPVFLRRRIEAGGFKIHSAHGCWGSQRIRADRVDLGGLEPSVRSASLDDLRHCVDWLSSAGGSCLVIHPGGLSDPVSFQARRHALIQGLSLLADHASGTGVTICVENMPPGVYPGSRMQDLMEIIEELNRPEVGLALDTGHANLSSSVSTESLASGSQLRTTHVHDNEGRQDNHLPPGQGTIDWVEWVATLDAIDYRGPIVLECIKHLRDHPESLTPELLARLRFLTGLEG
jgi:sugar phosphate isomerase/epimerase